MLVSEVVGCCPPNAPFVRKPWQRGTQQAAEVANEAPEVALQGAGWWVRGNKPSGSPQPSRPPGWVRVRTPAPSVIGGSKGHGPDRRRETSSSGSPAWFCPSFPGPGPPASSPDAPSSLLHPAGSAQAGKLLWDPFQPVQRNPLHGDFLLEEKQMASAWLCSAGGIEQRGPS